MGNPEYVVGKMMQAPAARSINIYRSIGKSVNSMIRDWNFVSSIHQNNFPSYNFMNFIISKYFELVISHFIQFLSR